MTHWFLAKIRHQQTDEKGKVKTVTSEYLLDAVSYTEAESKIYKKCEEIIEGDFFIKDLKRANFTDVFDYGEGEAFFKCKMTYDLEMDSGKSKKITNWVLISANHSEEAIVRAFDKLSGMLVDFTIPEVKETKILEVWPYESKEEPEGTFG